MKAKVKKTRKVEFELPVSLVSLIVSLVVTVLLFMFLKWLGTPATTLQSGGFWLLGIIMIFLFFIILGICEGIREEDGEVGGIIIFIGFLVDVVILIIWGLIYLIGSSEMMNSRAYQMIMPVETAEFQENFSDITQEEQPIAIVDFETAKIVGNRTIGSIPNASWYEVDQEFNLIKYQDKYYRISSLNYGGLFKYSKGKYTGLPGYVLVDAMTGEAKFVEVEGGYFYSPSAYYDKYLKRHLRYAFSKAIIEENYFEIDDEGHPYWITPIYEHSIGLLGGKKQIAVVITDAVSGTMERYQLNEIPEWVDHAFSLEYLTDRLINHYEYVNGYWNFSNTGVYKLAYQYRSSKASGGYFEGYTSVIGKDGEVYFYSGLTPANNSESNLGFVMMNTRTGQVTQYNYDAANSAEESSAQGAAESLVQNYGYQATFPIIVNVGGQPTYLMTLKDKACLVKKYAFCNIQNYSIVVENETMDGAMADYLKKLQNDSSETLSEDSEVQNMTATIEAVYTANIEGTTYFYYQIKDSDKLFKAPITVSEKQVVLKAGDKVTIEFVNVGTEYAMITQIEF